MKGIDRHARSYLKAMAILARTDPAIESAATIEDLPRPSSRKRARQQASLAHEDAEEQFVGSSLLSTSS
jgi:hypothetical protein